MCNCDEMHYEDSETMMNLIKQMEAQKKAWAEAEAKPVPLVVIAE